MHKFCHVGCGGIAKICTPRGLLCYVHVHVHTRARMQHRMHMAARYNETTLPTNWPGRGRNPIQLSNSFEGAG